MKVGRPESDFGWGSGCAWVWSGCPRTPEGESDDSGIIIAGCLEGDDGVERTPYEGVGLFSFLSRKIILSAGDKENFSRRVESEEGDRNLVL